MSATRQVSSLPRTTLVPQLRRPVVVFAPTATRTRSRGRSARAALAWGAVAALLATVALAAAVETAVPQLRDPEYGHRLTRVRTLQRSHPDRPLVVVLGTSRTQNAVSPAAMNFVDEPGSPLVFNFGLTGAPPLRQRLALQQFLADGVHPAAVLVEVCPVRLHIETADDLTNRSVASLAARDLDRLGPYTDDPAGLRQRWAAARCVPWRSSRALIVSHVAPTWLPFTMRLDYQWGHLDAFGFGPYPLAEVELRRAVRQEQARTENAGPLYGLQVSELTVRAHRDLVTDCRARGIAVAFVLMPESPGFRGWYSPQARESLGAYVRHLTAGLGCPVFEAPEHFSETDFADGHHMLPPAAARYSRWLADTHLRPWLATALK